MCESAWGMTSGLPCRLLVFLPFFLFVVVLIRGYEHRDKELAEEREWTCASGDAQEALQRTREGL
jgi:hypothetical protein